MEAKENILEELEVAQLRKQQYEHKIQLLENRKQHLEKKLTASVPTISAIWVVQSKVSPKEQIL